MGGMIVCHGIIQVHITAPNVMKGNKPKDGIIVRFNYKTNEYKEFIVPIISTETKLLKNSNKFIAINEKEIYEIG